ncbi:hypothetical protein Tco_0135031 [Tanacetum coccineum]
MVVFIVNRKSIVRGVRLLRSKGVWLLLSKRWDEDYEFNKIIICNRSFPIIFWFMVRALPPKARNHKVGEKPLLLVSNFVQASQSTFQDIGSMYKDVRSLAWIEFASEWTWETDKGNDMSNSVLRSYGINWYSVYRSAPSIQLFVHSWCVTENTAGVDDPAETMQNVGVRNMSKCQVIIGSRGLRQSPVLKSSTVTTKQSLADTTLEKDYRQIKESLFSFGAPIFGQVKDETSIKSQDIHTKSVDSGQDIDIDSSI